MPLNKSVINQLNKYKKNRKKKYGFKESWFIFGSSKPITKTTIDGVKDWDIEKANVNRITMHEFRHSHATLLISAGLDIISVSRRLGHSDVNITLGVYSHLLDKKNEEIVNFLEKSCQNLATSNLDK